MGLHANNELLRRKLEGTALLNNRYSGIELANLRGDGDQAEKRGCFSLVFKAFDEVNKKPVALKFYDRHPTLQNDLYRVAAFNREYELLQRLISHERCLQLVSAMETYNLESAIDGIDGVTQACNFFAVEWLDEELDDYFFGRHEITCIDKLCIFIKIVLAVEALHSFEIFHRDLKADNLRSYQDALKTIVVAIDLGTAARCDSNAISSQYQHHVGAPAYASPEAYCGLTSNRKLAPHNDFYALGCLLFEMFNPDLYAKAVRTVNANYDYRLSAIASSIDHSCTEEKQVQNWNSALGKFSKGVNFVAIDSEGSTVPPGVGPLLNELLHALTNFDYRNRRSGSDWIRLRLASSLKVLRNEKFYHERLVREKKSREMRKLAALAKVARFNARLESGARHANARIA